MKRADLDPSGFLAWCASFGHFSVFLSPELQGTPCFGVDAVAAECGKSVPFRLPAVEQRDGSTHTTSLELFLNAD